MLGVWVFSRKPCEFVVMATSAATTNGPWKLSGDIQQKFIACLTAQSLCCWSICEQLSSTSGLGTQAPSIFGRALIQKAQSSSSRQKGTLTEKRHIHFLHHTCSYFTGKSYSHSHGWKYSPWLHSPARLCFLVFIPSHERGYDFQW